MDHITTSQDIRLELPDERAAQKRDHLTLGLQKYRTTVRVGGVPV
jgi:hypothetical protein